MILEDVYNLFSYCENNPVMGVDYTGYLPKLSVIKPAPKEDANLLDAIRDSGLNKKRYATIKEYNGYTKKKDTYICVYRSSYRTYFYETQYYVYGKTRSEWLKYVKKYYGTQQAVSDFFEKASLHLGDPIFSTEPSVSNLASALSYASEFVSWSLIPREARYILRQLIRSNKSIVYIAKSARIRMFLHTRKYVIFGKYIWRIKYNKHVWAY